ncbi:MAG: hypothetical protein ACHQF2_07400 [Flavobacteriales bacterium]
MRIYILILLFSLGSVGVAQTIPVGFLLTIENEVDDAVSFKCWMEENANRRVNISYDNFKEKRINGRYMNTNLYAFTDRGVPMKNYVMHMVLTTDDTTHNFTYNVNMSSHWNGFSVTVLVGQNVRNKGFLKDVRISVSTIANKDSLYLVPLNKPKLKVVPRYEIINKLPVKLYTHHDHDYMLGDLVRKNEEGKYWTYAYVKPYQKLNCTDTSLFEPRNKIITYPTPTDCGTCAGMAIQDKGEFKFDITLHTGPETTPYPPENLKTNTTRLLVQRNYDLEHEFKVKK